MNHNQHQETAGTVLFYSTHLINDPDTHIKKFRDCLQKYGNYKIVTAKDHNSLYLLMQTEQPIVITLIDIANKNTIIPELELAKILSNQFPLTPLLFLTSTLDSTTYKTIKSISTYGCVSENADPFCLLSIVENISASSHTGSRSEEYKKLYDTLFKENPLGLWLVDYTEVKKKLDSTGTLQKTL